MKTKGTSRKSHSFPRAERSTARGGGGCRLGRCWHAPLLLIWALAPLMLFAQVSSVTRRTIQLPGPPANFFFQTNVPAAALAPTVQSPPAAVQVPVDPEKARALREETLRKTIEFQRQRAEGGSATAQYDLGLRYLNGDGVQTNLDQARKWLNLSASQTNHQAIQKLSELDRKPEGTR